MSLPHTGIIAVNIAAESLTSDATHDILGVGYGRVRRHTSRQSLGLGSTTMMQRGTNTVWERMLGAATLNPAAYEAVERDTDATVTAFLIVLGAAIATGIGAFTADGIHGL